MQSDYTVLTQETGLAPEYKTIQPTTTRGTTPGTSSTDTSSVAGRCACCSRPCHVAVDSALAPFETKPTLWPIVFEFYHGIQFGLARRHEAVLNTPAAIRFPTHK